MEYCVVVLPKRSDILFMLTGFEVFAVLDVTAMARMDDRPTDKVRPFSVAD
jgi:hypothetical protein